MNKCIICGNEFEPAKGYEIKKTCSKECYSKYMRSKISDGFKETQFRKGHKTFNKGVPQKEWMSKESQEKCSKTHIQYQENTASPLSKEEGIYLPHNTLRKGMVVKRSTTKRTGKNKGKVETNYFINIDWHGNRKPNNLYKKYLWELYNQMDLPKGYVVTTIDGDPDNLVIENLEIISRAELLRRNSGGRLGRKR